MNITGVELKQNQLIRHYRSSNLKHLKIYYFIVNKKLFKLTCNMSPLVNLNILWPDRPTFSQRILIKMRYICKSECTDKTRQDWSKRLQILRCCNSGLVLLVKPAQSLCSLDSRNFLLSKRRRCEKAGTRTRSRNKSFPRRRLLA